MISNSIDFEDNFIKNFGDISRNSLVAVKENRLRFELGGSLQVVNRIEQALYRSSKILQYCFGKSSIWLRIILWDESGKENLRKAGLKLNNADILFEEIVDGENILYIYFQEYTESVVYPIVLSIINYELGKEPFANLTCYFIDFSIPMLLNIYDDRGMDIVSPNKILMAGIAKEFNDWIIKLSA